MDDIFGVDLPYYIIIITVPFSIMGIFTVACVVTHSHRSMVKNHSDEIIDWWMMKIGLIKVGFEIQLYWVVYFRLDFFEVCESFQHDSENFWSWMKSACFVGFNDSLTSLALPPNFMANFFLLLKLFQTRFQLPIIVIFSIVSNFLIIWIMIEHL